MASIETLLNAGQVTLSVYSPDAVRGGLLGTLDQVIHQRLGCVPIRRAWVQHRDDTIESFYANSIAQNVPNFHLVTRLFTSGPSLATLWQGPEVLAEMPKIKGRSHPARAAAGTIRAGFWCDNPVCNLIHVSDDLPETYRELEVLRAAGCDLQGAQQPLLPSPASDDPPKPCHNGTRVLCEVLQRVLRRDNREYPLPLLPSNGNACQTVREAGQWLRQIQALLPSPLFEAVARFLTADLRPYDMSAQLAVVVPLTPWEDLLIRCAAVARKGWLDP